MLLIAQAASDKGGGDKASVASPVFFKKEVRSTYG